MFLSHPVLVYEFKLSRNTSGWFGYTGILVTPVPIDQIVGFLECLNVAHDASGCTFLLSFGGKALGLFFPTVILHYFCAVLYSPPRYRVTVVVGEADHIVDSYCCFGSTLYVCSNLGSDNHDSVGTQSLRSALRVVLSR